MQRDRLEVFLRFEMIKTTATATAYRQTGEESLAASLLESIFPERQLSRVLLVTPPDADVSIFNPDYARRGTYSNFPPYGLGLIANVFEDNGVKSEILNLNHLVLKDCQEGKISNASDFEKSWQGYLTARIDDFSPDLIGVTCMFTMTHDSLKAVCSFAAKSGIPLAIGGVHLTSDIERVLDEIPEASIAVLNEGEIATEDLIKAIRGGIEAGEMGQIVLNVGDRRLSLTADRRPDVSIIDAIPPYHKFEVSNLSRYGVVGSYQAFLPPDTRVATCLSNRGCRGRCTFCSVPSFNGKGVRHRSIEAILDEMELLRNDYGIRHIMWLDDDLFKDHKRAVQLFNGMVKRNLGMTWDASNGVLAVSCTDEVISAAAASGCIGIAIGIESGNDQILRSSRKPATVEINLWAAEVLNKYESIYSSAFIILGFPLETMSMIHDTVKACETMNLDWYRIKLLQPLPNTPVYEEMLDEGQTLDGEDLKGVRYMTGAYGKAHEIDTGEARKAESIEDVFSRLAPDHKPKAEEFDDIWFLMNYKLNYARVAREDRPVKLEKQNKFLRFLCDSTAPNNALAFYTKCIVEKKHTGHIDPATYKRFFSLLDGSLYWQDKFNTLGLSKDDLNA